MPRRKRNDPTQVEPQIVEAPNIIPDEAFVTAEAINKGLDPQLRRNVFAIMHKRMQSVDSFAKYVSRILVRYGLYVDYSSSLTPLSDGFRLCVEFRLRAADTNLFKAVWKSAKLSTTDTKGAARELKLWDRKATETEEINEDLDLEGGELDVGGGEDKAS